MHRRCASEFRQKRRMNVDETEARLREHGVGENLSVRGDDAEIGPEGCQACHELWILEALGLNDRHIGGVRSRFYGTSGDVMAAATRPIGLRDDAHHRMRRREERVERRHRECRRPEKHDAQGAAPYHLPARDSFLILRTIRSRLMPRRRSTKSVPSR